MSMLNRKLSADRLMYHMSRDKKMRDGVIHLILPSAIGQCHTTSTTPSDAVRDVLLKAGCLA
jgi:shikimate kinase/3-dehydroquinate synthase